MYLVKREVMATSIEKAMKEKGRIYCIELVEDKFQPQEVKPILGFNKKI